MSINDNIFDRIVDHMTDVRLYEEGIQLQNRRILGRHRKKLKNLLRRDIRSDVTPEVKRMGKELLTHSTSSLKEFSTSQLDFHTDNLHKDVRKFYKTKKPTTKQLLAEIQGPNIKGSRKVKKNIENISSGELVRIQSKVKAGLAEGKSQKEIINNVLKTTKLTEHQAKTLTRTSITATQSAALANVVSANKSLIKGYVFTAILDSRTSPICSHHNGKIYDVGDTTYLPPLHWNCRSTLVPIVKSKKELQESKSTRVNKEELSKVKPERMTGNTKPVEGFGAWLSKQGFATQEKILGGFEKANLFRTGKLKVEEFVTAAGKGLSISALRRKAAAITAVYPNRQKIRETIPVVKARNTNVLLNNPTHKTDLRNTFLNDSDDYNQAIALTDFRGTSLIGKQASRRRVSNQYDERNFSVDPMTGEVKNTLLYDPNYDLYQERIDFMRGSKLLRKEQKDFIEDMAGSMEGRLSVNQQTVVIENLRVVFERQAKDKLPWDNLASVVRAENRFAVQNVSRLLDTRSRKKSAMFSKYLTEDQPKIQIMGEYYDFNDLQKDMFKDQKFIDNWRATEGKKLANKIYLTGRSPMRVYFKSWTDQYPSKESFIKKLKTQFPLEALAYDKAKAVLKGKDPSDSWTTTLFAKGREKYQKILALEFDTLKRKPRPSLVDETALNTITKAVKLIVSGQSTDYDALAINIGKMYSKDFKNIIPFTKHTMKDHHKEGSTILNYMEKQGLIKTNFRGKVRRGVLDLDTGRASGSWGDTLSREVVVVDKKLLKLQIAERKVTIATRLGVVSDRDRLYVKANSKVYHDARGKQTSKSIITRRAAPDFNEKQIDRDFSNMLNQVMDTEYEVDSEFFDFMDKLVRFRDPRGDTKKWDELNEFRHLILQRGEQGYSMMATAKWHRQRGKPFRTYAQIDGRGRVYHTGYLSPTGGETVRPFLNSARKTEFTPEALFELRTQTGAMLGPSTEALTEAGRQAIFKRNEKGILEIGTLLQSTTQRDRRIKAFLEHPIVRKFEGEEIPKIARLALEYTRVHNHAKGDFSVSNLKKYKTQLMIENDASSSGAQIIGLSTRDRDISINSNVLATNQKNRLYDLVAMDTANDPDLLKIPALRDADIDWEDLAKAAKAQNMVSFYGAGEATQAANIEAKFAKVLEQKGYLVITKQEITEVNNKINSLIKVADRSGATTTVSELKAIKGELSELVNKNEPIGRALLKQAEEVHPDVADFANKLTNSRRGIVGPKEFQAVSEIMSKHLAERAPVTKSFVQFWNATAKKYVRETNSTDIPWVTFDGKELSQRSYRPRVQERIEFTDPVSGRKVANVYEAAAADGKLLGKASIADAGIGTGVNGNHMNDATLVRQFHLWGRKNNVPTASIHDAFFTNIGDSDLAKTALREIYADALDGETIRKTLKAMRKNGMSRSTYNERLAEAKRLGLIDPPNKITRRDILAPIPEGKSWYGIGP